MIDSSTQAKVTQMTQFNVGQNYSTRSIGDHDCIFTWQIIRRTASSVWIQEVSRWGELRGKVERKKVTMWDGQEIIYPNGKYSMAPILRADDKCLLPSVERINLERDYNNVQEQINQFEELANEIHRNFSGEAAMVRIKSLEDEMGIDMLYRRAKKTLERIQAA